MKRLTSCGVLSALDRFVSVIWCAAGLVSRKTGLGGVLGTHTRLQNSAAVARFGLVHRRDLRPNGGKRGIGHFAGETMGGESTHNHPPHRYVTKHYY